MQKEIGRLEIELNGQDAFSTFLGFLDTSRMARFLHSRVKCEKMHPVPGCAGKERILMVAWRFSKPF